MLRLSAVPLLAAGLLLAGCSKPVSSGSQGSAPAVAESGPVIAEFGSADPSAWVNGAPMTLASARGGVVLVEAWERY